MEKNKKILLGGVIAVVVVGVVVSICLTREVQTRTQGFMIPLSQSPKVVEPMPDGSIPPPSVQRPDLSSEAIANWSVCRNEKYGYEFKYPKGWILSGSDPIFYEDKTYPQSIQQFFGTPACNSFDIEIFQEKFNDYSSSQIRISILVQDKSVWDAVIRSTKEEYVGDRSFLKKEFMITGKKVIYYTDSHAFRAGIFYKKDNFIFLSMYQGEQKLMDAIVSTFKFID